MSPKFVDKKQRKKEIALIALDLFAEKGFESTSISEVAKEARIGKGTIYEYFSSKEELVLEAMKAWIEQITQGMELLIEEIDDPLECFRTAVTASMEGFISDEHTVKIMISMFQVVLTNEEFYRQNPVMDDMMQEFRKLIVDLLLDGVSQGVFKPEIAKDVEKIAINLFAYLDGVGFHYLVNKNHFDLMEQVNFYLDRLVEYIRISN